MKRIIAFLLAAVMCLTLTACGGSSISGDQLDQVLSAVQELQARVDDVTAQIQEAAADAQEAAEAKAAAEVQAAEEAALAEEEAEPAAEADEGAVNVMVLNGTTGFGMAKLISDAANGAAALNYNVSVETDASNVTAALISGAVDIAALPTNAAATVYNKTGGGVQIAAINTKGVLYVVANTENTSIASLSDLAGMTVYAPAQNPTFIFQALADAAGVDVTIDNTYAQPADLRTAIAAGEIDVAVLPEPMATIACAANESLVPVVDLTAAWDEAIEPGTLVQGCVVVRTDFAQEHPETVAAFLKEYEASIAFLTEDTDAAAQMIEDAGIFAQAAVAKKAIPHCNICFLAGDEMKSAMNRYCEILFDLEPASVGGAVPAEDFYYLG